MSLSTNEVIKCPDCGASYTFTCHPSINAQTDPHLREAVLSGEAFTSRCPKCGKTIQVVYPCLYQSPKQGFMIYFLPGYEQRVLKVDGEMEQLFESREASTRRVVDSYRGLCDKILLLENGFNDYAMELFKAYTAITIATGPNKENAPEEICFSGLSGDGEILMIGYQKDRQTQMTAPKGLYNTLVRDYGELWELKTEHFVAIDMLWALEFIKAGNAHGQMN